MSIYQIIGLSFAGVALATFAVWIVESITRKSRQLTLLPLTQIMIWAARILVGGLFIYSGFVKANDYIGFAYKLDEYFAVFNLMFLRPIAEPTAWFISVFEIVLGVAILVGYSMPLTAWLALLMMVFFTFLTGYSHVTGAVTDCGCFGDALKIAPWESFVKDLILIALLIPVFIFRKQIKPFPNTTVAIGATLLTGVVFGIFSYYCHENLPLIDYRPYKVGTNLAICTTEMGPEGYPKCKDWNPIPYKDASAELFKGNTLMIIMYNMKKAPEKALAQSVELTQALSGMNIGVIGATSSGPSYLDEALPKLGINYPFVLLDEVALKTIVRSNPGYMLLKDGVVMKKWHYNNTPTVGELTDLLR